MEDLMVAWVLNIEEICSNWIAIQDGIHAMWIYMFLPFLRILATKAVSISKVYLITMRFLFVSFVKDNWWLFPKTSGSKMAIRYGASQNSLSYIKFQWNKNICFDPSRSMLKIVKYDFLGFSILGKNYCSSTAG